MATFKVQIEDLVGSVGDDAALSDWLTAGAKELINIFPYELKMECAAVTNLYIDNTNTTMDLDSSGKILHVTRENADSGYYTPCREIPPMYGDLTNDSSNMMYYATATDPVYWRESNSSGAATLFVKPTPTSLQPAKVYHVSFPSVAHGDSAIANFPDEADYLVVLYASVKALQRLMNNMGGISDLSISSSAPTIPNDPSISGGSVGAVAIASLPTAPTYTAPTVGGVTEELTATMDADSSGYGTEADFLNFSKWFSVASEFIEDEEDSELAQSQLQKIQTYLQAYSSALQNQLNVFNKNSVVYQAGVQRNLEQARIDMQDAQKEADLTLQAAIQDYSLELQKYQQELALYQQNVNKEVTQYTTNLQQYGLEYQWYQSQQAKLQQDYDKGVQMLISDGAPRARGN